MGQNDSSQNDEAMRHYYKQRAPVYDRVYEYPERQSDLRYLESYIPSQFKDLKVLEIAAGTGYWSQFIVKQAATLLATDATEETLDQITLREIDIQTKVVDAYKLAGIDERFDALFAGHWISHVPIERRKEFFSGIHKLLNPGARVILLDNSKSQLKRLPLSSEDSFGNTYQSRQLDDGSSHKVLKNFPTEGELLEDIGSDISNAHFRELSHFWFFEYIYQLSA